VAKPHVMGRAMTRQLPAPQRPGLPTSLLPTTLPDEAADPALSWEDDAPDVPWPAVVPDDPLEGPLDFGEPPLEPWSPLEAAEDLPGERYFEEPVEETPPALSLLADLPILGWTAEVRVEGRSIRAAVDPCAVATTWFAPRHRDEVHEERLWVDGVLVVARVERGPSDVERLVIGRDVLSGRFLFRP
jgi:hypothetical protein